ncbi:MAG TPA: hypothetical protein VLH08_19815 [Acidobacteriota bacterium]|nr:hypothetical protein [Acidobacteriota bacterium]
MNYVSVQCSDGDIELDLEEDGHFSLEKKIWDNNEHKHTQILTLSGTYNINHNTLVLHSPDNRLQYKKNNIFSMRIGDARIVLDSWEWISSQKPSFADSISLVQKEPVDDFFLSAIDNKKRSWWKFWE